MGGIGAMRLAFRYPDVYAVVVPMSGHLFDIEHDPVWEYARSKYGYEPTDFGEYASMDSTIRLLMALAAAAAPNPSKPPFYLDMPFSIVDGQAEIDPEVLRKVIGLDVTNDIRSYLDQPLRLNGLLLYRDTNKGADPADEAVEAESHRRMREALTEAGIDYEFEQVEAAHCTYDLTPIIKFMNAKLAF
jgi:pimeloyl-ACP methyl ester carboxylesterase